MVPFRSLERKVIAFRFGGLYRYGTKPIVEDELIASGFVHGGLQTNEYRNAQSRPKPHNKTDIMPL